MWELYNFLILIFQHFYIPKFNWVLRILFSFFWGSRKSQISKPLGTLPGTFWHPFLTFPDQSEGKHPTKTIQTEPQKNQEKWRSVLGVYKTGMFINNFRVYREPFAVIFWGNLIPYSSSSPSISQSVLQSTGTSFEEKTTPSPPESPPEIAYKHAR